MRRPVLLLLLFIAAILVAPIFAPYDHRGSTEVTVIRNQHPNARHPMGTDGNDRDVLTLVLKGSRQSLIIAVGAMAIALFAGVVVGLLAAFGGGSIDTFVMRTIDIALSIPRFLILLTATSIASETLSTEFLILLIGLTGWFDIARLTRGEVASLLGRDWVVAARAMGTGELRLATRHIFPHLVPMLMVVLTLGIGHNIVLEAGLMYLGVGNGGTSLGGLLQSGAGISSLTKWWLAVFPGLAIVLIVLACNALGDALRDVFAPEQVHAWPTT